MSLEAPGFITGLVPSNPTSTDPKSQGDDHLRLIKQALLSSLPAIDAAMTVSSATLNALPARVSSLEAVTVPTPADALPLAATLAGAVGVGVEYAREDHVHPSGQASGDVLQTRLMANSGSSTASGSYVNMSGTACSITPRQSNNLILIEISFAPELAPAGASPMSASFSVMQSSVAIGSPRTLTVSTTQGPQGFSVQVPGYISWYIQPANVSPLAFTLAAHATGGTVYSGPHVIKATEIAP